MFKKYILIPAAAILLAGCMKDAGEVAVEPEKQGDEVAVKMSLGIPSLSTSTEIVPMTKAGTGQGDYRVLIMDCYLYVMKHIEDKLIVDQVIQVYKGNKYFKEGESQFDFDLLLRPGTYTFTAVVNSDGANRNKSLQQGSIVYDKNQPRTSAEVVVSYTNLDGGYNMGFEDALSSKANVYIGTLENYVVSKSPDLGTSPVPAEIDIPLNNVMGKVRLLGKPAGFDGDLIKEWPNYIAATLLITNTSDKEFPYGYSILGEPAYRSNLIENPEKIMYNNPLAGSKELRLVVEMKHEGKMYTGSDGKEYAVSFYVGRASGVFYFTDYKDSEGITGNLGDLVLTCQSGLPSLTWLDAPGGNTLSEDYVFGVKTINTLAVELLDEYWQERVTLPGGGTQMQGFMLLRKAQNDMGQEIDPTTLFGPYLECNL